MSMGSMDLYGVDCTSTATGWLKLDGPWLVPLPVAQRAMSTAVCQFVASPSVISLASTFLFSTFSLRDNINYDILSIITRSAESLVSCEAATESHLQGSGHVAETRTNGGASPEEPKSMMVANVSDATMLCPSVAVLNSQSTTNSPCKDSISPHFPLLLSLCPQAIRRPTLLPPILMQYSRPHLTSTRL
jgi:hypothetical protein